MEIRSFPVQFEKAMKTKIASELDLIPLSQRYNVDLITKDMTACIELKLRQEYPHKKVDHFSPRKKQLSSITRDYILRQKKDRVTGRTFAVKTFDYLFLKYRLPVTIASIVDISQVIDDVRICAGYFTDHRFVAKYDTAGLKSLWYSMTETTLLEHATAALDVYLVGSKFRLYLVPERYRHVPSLARTIFEGKIISSHRLPS